MAFLNEKGVKAVRDDYVQRVDTVKASLAEYLKVSESSKFVESTALESQLGAYAKTETVDGQLAQKLDISAVKDKVKEVYGDVATWGGSVADYAALASEKSEADNGTIFNVTETGENYIKTAEGFDKFDVKVDLTPYIKSADVDTKLQEYVTNDTLDGKGYIDQSTLDSKHFVTEESLTESVQAIDDSTILEIIAGTYQAEE